MSQEEIEVEAIGIEVSSQPIELYKVLKIANAVSGGGEAKFAIAEGYVAVNGELEQRKRRKMYDGDLVEFNEEYYVVLCDQPVQEPSEEAVKPKLKKPSENKPQQKKAKNSNKSTANKKGNKSSNGNKGGQKKSSSPKETSKADQSTGRKLISF
ncbi:RNA-binding S4 domain-containing protein [Photobacterium lipolyticum]|uniref:Urease n=1 Tax=Photobacterium lipolyticum TaxID=266810 RepID=A0A2T3N0K8_9GAMM|nr:RNA-binding S4 domain-containing protein [Photobacterium lipolyticum]PSW05765.1 urease [Photobacterium lipolyticum]